MSNFKEWYNEIADMPTQDDEGKWYDMEDGLYFQDLQRTKAASPRKKLSSKGLDFRAQVKQLGGVALKGTIKQKEWAEKIRHEKILQVEEDQQKLMVSVATLEKSKFWIDNREVAAGAIAHYAKNLMAAIKAANQLGRFLEKLSHYGVLNLLPDGLTLHRSIVKLIDESEVNFDLLEQINAGEVLALTKLFATEIEAAKQTYLKADHARLVGLAEQDLLKKARVVMGINVNTETDKIWMLEACRLYFKASQNLQDRKNATLESLDFFR